MLVPDGDGLVVSVPVVPELLPVELLPEYGEVLDGLDPVVPLALLPVLLVSLLVPGEPMPELLPVEPMPVELPELLPVEPMPVELLPVSLLLPVESVPVEVLSVVSELLPVPIVDEGPVPVVEVPEEPVPIELGSFVVGLDEPLP